MKFIPNRRSVDLVRAAVKRTQLTSLQPREWARTGNWVQCDPLWANYMECVKKKDFNEAV